MPASARSKRWPIFSTDLHKGFKPFFLQNSRDDEKSAAREMLIKRFALFEQQLQARAFVLVSQFSVADCYMFVMLFWARAKVGLEIPANQSAYFDRLKQRDAVKTTLADKGLA